MGSGAGAAPVAANKHGRIVRPSIGQDIDQTLHLVGTDLAEDGIHLVQVALDRIGRHSPTFSPALITGKAAAIACIMGFVALPSLVVRPSPSAGTAPWCS
jgi:hypothetical protein